MGTLSVPVNVPELLAVVCWIRVGIGLTEQEVDWFHLLMMGVLSMWGVALLWMN